MGASKTLLHMEITEPSRVIWQRTLFSGLVVVILCGETKMSQSATTERNAEPDGSCGGGGTGGINARSEREGAWYSY